MTNGGLLVRFRRLLPNRPCSTQASATPQLPAPGQQTGPRLPTSARERRWQAMSN